MIHSDAYHEFIKKGVNPEDSAKGIDVFVEPVQLAFPVTDNIMDRSDATFWDTEARHDGN